ncbi:MAG: AtuA-related protein [Ktedonobacteraceae bacterium]
MKKQLLDLAHARSGDKGDIANIALFASDRATYDLLVREVTAERVRTHFDGIVTGKVERYEVPNVLALNFVMHGALNGGASRSLRSDALGKSLSSALLRMEIEV